MQNRQDPRRGQSSAGQQPSGQSSPIYSSYGQSPRGPASARPASNGQMPNRQPPRMTAEEAARRREALARQQARKAALERQRMLEEQKRRKERQRAVRVFFGRALVCVIILLILAAVTAVCFWLHFNRTEEPGEPARVTYTFGGSDGGTLTEDLAIRDGILYVDFHAVADYLGMTAVGGGDTMRYVITNTETDSAGDGTEEDVIFHASNDLVTVNGQNARMDGIAVLHGDHYLVPVSFISDFMEGVTVVTETSAVTVSRLFTDAEGQIPAAVSFILKPAEPIPSLPPEDSGTATPDVPVTPEAPIEFISDLSAYEEYMNPADRDGFLLLVNADHLLDANYLPPDLTDLKDTRKDGRAVQKMVKTAAMSLEAMYIELRANGYTDVSVTSAYRAYSYQQYLFNMYTDNEMKKNPSLTRAEAEAITETYSARPGTSEHQSGLCCDMHNLGGADQAFAKKEAYKWLKDNCWKFGFIIRFPEGKEDITGISFEPWHYRFVGRYHAKAIYDSGLCLEEYLDTLE